MNSALVVPIRKRITLGHDKDAIKKEALSHGYTEDEFESAYSEALSPHQGNKEDTPAPAENRDHSTENTDTLHSPQTEHDFKYKPSENPSFWVALLVAVVTPIISYIFQRQGKLFDPTVLLYIVFLFGWVGWVVFKKGKKWSLVQGLFFAILLTILLLYPLSKIEQKKLQEERAEALEEWRRSMQQTPPQGVRQGYE